MSQQSYQVKKRDGSVHGPYSIAVIRAFLMSGKFEAYDSLLIDGTEEPIFRSTAFQDLFELSLGDAGQTTDPSETSDSSGKFIPSPSPNVDYPYPLDPRTLLSREQLHTLLCKREKDGSKRPLFFRGQLLPPDVRPSYGGNLGKFNILKLLSRLYSTQQTGRVHIRQGRDTVDVFFENGHLVYAASSLESTRLGQIIVTQKLMTQSEINEALETTTKSQVSLGLYLLETGRIPEQLLQHVFTEQFRQRIFTACSWRNGLYRFYNGQKTGHHFPIQFDTPLLFKEAVYEHISNAVIHEQLYPCWNRRLTLLQHPRLRAELFHLSQSELGFVKLIKNDAPLRDMVALAVEQGELSEDEISKLVYLFWQIDLFAFREELMGERTRQQLDELDSKIALYKHLGLLDRLGLQAGANPNEIRAAYLALAKQYHPDQQPPGTHSMVLRKMEALFAMIAEAYRILR
jgi:hypothetical protein